MSTIAPNSPENALTADETVYRRLKQAILENRLPPGIKLTEERLSVLFGVSRERVRRVLQRLSYDKCVDLIPNRGAFVATPTVRDAKEVFDARVLLETHIVELVAAGARESDYTRLEDNIASERDAHHRDRIHEAIALSGEFHILLAEVSGNRVFVGILRDLVARSSLIIAQYGWRLFSLCGYEEHLEFLSKLRQQKVPVAKKLLQQHLEALVGRLHFEPRPLGEVDLDDVFRQEHGGVRASAMDARG